MGLSFFHAKLNAMAASCVCVCSKMQHRICYLIYATTFLSKLFINKDDSLTHIRSHLVTITYEVRLVTLLQFYGIFIHIFFLFLCFHLKQTAYTNESGSVNVNPTAPKLLITQPTETNNTSINLSEKIKIKNKDS